MSLHCTRKGLELPIVPLICPGFLGHFWGIFGLVITGIQVASCRLDSQSEPTPSTQWTRITLSCGLPPPLIAEMDYVPYAFWVVGGKLMGRFRCKSGERRPRGRERVS